MAEEITYFRFMSEVRAFLAKLLKDPIGAQPSKYLKNRGVTRKWLVDNLIARDVLERHEKILDPTNSDEKKAKYVVKFKVRKKDFEKRVYKIYIKKFESNVNESVFADEENMKKKILDGPDGKVYRERGGINEEGDGAAGGGAGAGAGGAASDGGSFNLGGTSEAGVGELTGRGDIGFDTSFGMIDRKPIGGRPKEKKNDNGVKPENVLGKNLVSEKKNRRIYVTEEQLKAILSEELNGATTTTTVAQGTDNGMLGYPRPDKQFNGSNGKKGDEFWDPAMERKPGFSVRRIGDK